MGATTSTSEISDAQMEAILDIIDEETPKSVGDLAENTGYPSQQVQLILEALMEKGMITSTPDWQYREARRSEA